MVGQAMEGFNHAGEGTGISSYADARANYDISQNEKALFGPNGIRNAAELCCDAHCGFDRLALRWRSADGRRAEFTFEELREKSSRFASVLANLGVGQGDFVACLLPRTPELLITALAAWRLGALYQPLFTAFGPKAIEHRITVAGAKVIVTDSTNRAKLDEFQRTLHIVNVTRAAGGCDDEDIDFRREIDRAEPLRTVTALGPDDPFLIMFTSGTTGSAKPLLIPLKAITPFANYAIDAMGLQPQDAFWNIADPGWGYGLYFGVVGPLATGHSILFYDGPFTVESTVDIIREYGITNLAGAPTAFRHLAAAGPGAIGIIKGQLRVVSSAGEPLSADVIRWFAENLHVVVHDHYGQTEAGMVVCNHHGLEHPVRPGSAGFPSPGYRVVVIDERGRELPAGQPGHLAIDRTNSPLFWFAGYHGAEAASSAETYYLSGDTAEINEDGSISFVGRADDVITSSGYRIGPYDVESALGEHPAVIEAGVIGKPDPQRTEIVKAFVVLAEGYAASPELAEELRQHVRRRLSAHSYPREIDFVDELPKTPSGKIQRFVLRRMETTVSA